MDCRVNPDEWASLLILSRHENFCFQVKVNVKSKAVTVINESLYNEAMCDSTFLTSALDGQLYATAGFTPSRKAPVSSDGVSTLSWWWGLSAPETLIAMPAVA
jgi:hypothetical protein